MGRSHLFRIHTSVRRELTLAAEHGTPEAPDAHGPAGGLNAPDIWSAVGRIRSSRSMSGCHRLVQLLNFVVGSTLRGEAAHLKETTIGVAVFGRSPDYDPKVDTIVRSQAWRLRAKLKDYYATEGAHDAVLIDIVKGQYSATFSLRQGAVVEHAAITVEHRSHGSRR